MNTQKMTLSQKFWTFFGNPFGWGIVPLSIGAGHNAFVGYETAQQITTGSESVQIGNTGIGASALQNAKSDHSLPFGDKTKSKKPNALPKAPKSRYHRDRDYDDDGIDLEDAALAAVAVSDALSSTHSATPSYEPYTPETPSISYSSSYSGDSGACYSDSGSSSSSSCGSSCGSSGD